MRQVTVLEHPLAATLLTRLRDADTGAEAFRAATFRLGTLLAAEALATLPTVASTVRTPLRTTAGRVTDARLAAVPVLRAGLGLLEPVRALMPEADVGLVGVRRNEATLAPEPYMTQLPPLQGVQALVLEPMLATGGSACYAAQRCAHAGAADITLASVVAAPEGIERFTAEHPGARVVTASVDDGLDERGFIVPGLGDFGDRLLGT